MAAQLTDTRFVVWLEDLGRDDVPLVGGKNASLGEMVRRLKSKGVLVPPGFATTSAAYRMYVEANGIARSLARRLEALAGGKASLHETGEAVRRLFLDGEFPADIAAAICEAYRKLSGATEASVAVRSSATAEDLPDASLAGQQGNVSKCARRARVTRCVPALLRLVVHGPGDLLSPDEGIRSPASRAIHRRSAHGPVPDSFVATAREVARVEQRR
nr:PEP/pyruvate-binding domain-containing protein [Peristeroidobacter soli]